MRGRLLLGVFVLGLVAIGVAAAGLNRNWSDHANGSQEVPPRDTQGQAQTVRVSAENASREALAPLVAAAEKLAQ